MRRTGDVPGASVAGPSNLSGLRDADALTNSAMEVRVLDDFATNVGIRGDIDSFFICAQRLTAFAPPKNFSVSLKEAHASVSCNTKSFGVLNEMVGEVDGAGPRYRYRDFVFGGYGMEAIYVLYRIDGKVNLDETHARWKFHQTNTLEAIAALPRSSRTRSNTPSKVTTFGATTLRIFEEDWLQFSEAMVNCARIIDGVDVFFYKAVHGLKLRPQIALEEIERLVGAPEEILFAQVHHAVEFAVKGSLVTFDLQAVRKMTTSKAWEAASVYRKYFLRERYGHFSGLTVLDNFPNVTSAQGYEPPAHLLPDKRAPPIWLRHLFHGMSLAPNGDRLNSLGARLSNDEARLQEYFDHAAEEGISARFEAVFTYEQDVLDCLGRDVRMHVRLKEELFRHGAVVEIVGFDRHVRRNRRVLLSPLYDDMGCHAGCLQPSDNLAFLMDQAALRHAWLQGYGKFTDASRYEKLRVGEAALDRRERGSEANFSTHRLRSGMTCVMTAEQVRYYYECPTTYFADYVEIVLRYIAERSSRPPRGEVVDKKKDRERFRDGVRTTLWSLSEMAMTPTEVAEHFLNLLGLYAREKCGLSERANTKHGEPSRIFSTALFDSTKGPETRLGPTASTEEVTNGILSPTFTYGIMALCACYHQIDEDAEAALKFVIKTKVEVFPAKLWGRVENTHHKEWNNVMTLAQIAERDRLIRPESEITAFARGKMNLAQFQRAIRATQEANEKLALRYCADCTRDVDAVAKNKEAASLEMAKRVADEIERRREMKIALEGYIARPATPARPLVWPRITSVQVIKPADASHGAKRQAPSTSGEAPSEPIEIRPLAPIFLSRRKATKPEPTLAPIFMPRRKFMKPEPLLGPITDRGLKALERFDAKVRAGIAADQQRAVDAAGTSRAPSDEEETIAEPVRQVRRSLQEYIDALQALPPRVVQDGGATKNPLKEEELMVILAYGMEHIYAEKVGVKGNVLWTRAEEGPLRFMNRTRFTLRNAFHKLAEQIVDGEKYRNLVTEQELERLARLFPRKR